MADPYEEQMNAPYSWGQSWSSFANDLATRRDPNNWGFDVPDWNTLFDAPTPGLEEVREETARNFNAQVPSILGVAQSRGLGAGSGAEAALLSRAGRGASSAYAQQATALRQQHRQMLFQRYMSAVGARRALYFALMQYKLAKDQQSKSFWGQMIQTALGVGGTIAGAAIGGPAGAVAGGAAGSELGPI